MTRLKIMKITIFWLAWSWTSTIWKKLSKHLWYKFMSSWNIMRSWASELWISLYEFEDKIAKNDHNFDKKLDNKVKDFWLKNNNFVFESRLAWYFIQDSFKIYLHCDETERYSRIHLREKWDLQDIIYKNTKRERGVVKRYKSVYPDILFPPDKKDFDLVIDSTNIKPDEILEIIIVKIREYI